jgi:hypothetical protein
MEPEGSSPNLQELSTCTYPEPNQTYTKMKNSKKEKNLI